MTVERSAIRWRSRLSAAVEMRPPADGEPPKAKVASLPVEPTGWPSTVAPSAARQSSIRAMPRSSATRAQAFGGRRVPGFVDGEQGPRARPDETVGVGGFEERPMGSFDVGEDGAAAGEDDEVGDRRRRDGRHDDLAAVAYVDGEQGEVQGGRPPGDRHDAPFEEGLGGLLQAYRRRSLGEPARLEGARCKVGALALAVAGHGPLAREPDHLVVA